TVHTIGADAFRYFLGAVICMLISRLGQTNRRRVADLRHAAEQLEAKVQERTREAVEAADATRKALENVREQAELLNLAHDAILSLDLDFTICFWNHGAERTYGWTQNEAIGQKSYELLGTEFDQPREKVYQQLLTDGRWESELTHTTRTGVRLK